MPEKNPMNSTAGILVFTAAVALLPLSPCWVLSLPIGIWTLAVLTDRDVKKAFASKKELDASS